MKDVKNLKIAYIGGGSRQWGRNFMNDLALEKDLGGSVYLYDIDFEAAKKNEKIGNVLSARDDVVGKWKYVAVPDLKTALENADFVVISILPATFQEMASDVHTPEKYGIYQSVGDTTGPGGIVRALRTVPMFAEFAEGIKNYCPDAWVINFTNPMSMCVRALYKVFPEIKAFGCCHEVFCVQRMLASMVKKKLGIEKIDLKEIKVNVLGINHFTWFTDARYRGMDLFPMYAEYVNENPNGIPKEDCGHWANGVFENSEKVKFDLFKRFGAIAAAGDRHLAEFCPGAWYLHNPETVKKYGFALTPVSYRIEQLEELLKKSEELYNGKPFELYETGEEAIQQIRALLGLEEFVTNVNIPNLGQMPDAPIGAIVETNAYFSGDSVRPVVAGKLPMEVNALVERVIEEQETVVEAALTNDYEMAFKAFINNPNVCIPIDEARALFDEMLYNTRAYLPGYEAYSKE